MFVKYSEAHLKLVVACVQCLIYTLNLPRNEYLPIFALVVVAQRFGVGRGIAMLSRCCATVPP